MRSYAFIWFLRNLLKGPKVCVRKDLNGPATWCCCFCRLNSHDIRQITPEKKGVHA